MSKLTVVDLFSGAGGLSRGFLDAGYDVLLGVDFDETALKTFKANHGNSEVLKLDLFDFNNIDKISEFLKENKKNVDVLVGGPPCQGFSLAGPRDVNDERNRLYLAMVETAKRLKPRAVVLENVPGLLQLNEGKAAKRIIEDFSEIGYNIHCKILYAPEYGIPQIRKRVFFVGFIKMISMVPEGKNYKALPEKYRSMYKYNEALTRYHSKKPSLTINTGHRSHFHYKYNRIPTVRESARLQSFPDDFIFYGNKTEQYKQVGNAVPPLLGKALAEKLKNTLEK